MAGVGPGDSRDDRPHEPRLAIVVLFAATVLLFRVSAWLNPSSFVVIPPSLGLPLNGLGVLYLVCGVWAWLSNPSYLTRVFLVVGIGGGIHWGGTIASGNPELGIAFLVFYAAVTAIGDAAFLDLSLRYPRATRWRGRRVLSLYLLGLLTLITVPIAPFLPRNVVEAGLGFVITLAFLMSIVGGIVFLMKWFRATREERRVHFLTPIVAVLVVSSGFDFMAEAGVLPGQPEAWTLMYGLEPLVLAWAVTRVREDT